MRWRRKPTPGPDPVPDSRGFGICAGYRFAVTDIYLRDGKFFVEAIRGATPAGGGYLTLFSADGRGVGQFPTWCEWDDCHGLLTIVQPFVMRQMAAAAGARVGP